MGFYIYSALPSDPKEREAEKNSKVQKLIQEINKKFEELEAAADKEWKELQVEAPDGSVHTYEPWQASGGCEWEQSRDGDGWNSSSC